MEDGNGYRNNRVANSGGGATDIALFGTADSSSWNLSNHFYSRIIVAGGGGGHNGCSEDTTNSADSCYGGGISGGAGISLSRWSYGGTQISGGIVNTYEYITTAQTVEAGFGIGGAATGNSGYETCGGGGGWYGGGRGDTDGAGGGGSGWVYTESNYNTWKSGNPTDATKYLLNSSYYLTNAETKAGNTSFPSPTSSGNETGHRGNGYARITPIN